ncbi:Opioid-binding protein/cell adhesion molecule [Manis javanica]|nr:Opioid-binding protein/cell adhesion molecule [Manis javanica]
MPKTLCKSAVLAAKTHFFNFNCKFDKPLSRDRSAGPGGVSDSRAGAAAWKQQVLPAVGLMELPISPGQGALIESQPCKASAVERSQTGREACEALVLSADLADPVLCSVNEKAEVSGFRTGNQQPVCPAPPAPGT